MNRCEVRMILLDTSALYPLAKLVSGREHWVASRLVDEEAHILDLTLYELGNALLIEEKRGIVVDATTLLSGVRELFEVVGVIRMRPDHFGGIYRVAHALGLTFYDAAYVYHARKLGAKLVTQDVELLRKAGDVAVSLSDWLGEG